MDAFVCQEFLQSINISVYLVAVSIWRLTLNVISDTVYLRHDIVSDSEKYSRHFERQLSIHVIGTGYSIRENLKEC